MNHARITRTLLEESERLVTALADDPNDPRVWMAAQIIARNARDMAEIVARPHAPAVTLLRGGYDAPHLPRQLDDAAENGPSLPDVLIQLRSNVVDFETERARRRGLGENTGA